MKNPLRLLLAATLAGLLAATACTKAQETAAIQAAETIGIQAASCVLAQAVGGNASAVGIATVCGIPAGVNVLDVVATLLSSLQGPAADGGAAVIDPASKRAQIIAALKAVH